MRRLHEEPKIVRSLREPVQQLPDAGDLVRGINRGGQLRVQIEGIPVHLLQAENLASKYFKRRFARVAPENERGGNAALSLVVLPARLQSIRHAVVPQQGRVVVEPDHGTASYREAVMLELPAPVEDGRDVPQLRIHVDLDEIDLPDTRKPLLKPLPLLAVERGPLVDD